MRLFELFGKAFTPKNMRPYLREYLLKAGITKEPYELFGLIFFISLFVTIGLYFSFVVVWAQAQGPVISFIASFVTFTVTPLLFLLMFVGIMYFYIDTIIFQRLNEIEQILPDYLQLVSTNVKSGMSLEKSLWYSIKPRFGVLAVEMEIVLKKVMTGYDLAESLNEFSFKYESSMVRRSFGLIIGELDSGGKISHIIDSVVVNLKNNQRMKAEMSASVITYMIFIGLIVIAISPVLFALSYHLLNFMGQFVTKVIASGGSNSFTSSPIKLQSGAVNLAEFQQFSIAAICVVSILSSMIVSILEKGNVRGGLKYIPLFVTGSLICYFLFVTVLGAIFSGIVI